MLRDQFIATYVASWLAARAAMQYDEHCTNGHHPYADPAKVPVEDAYFLAEKAWESYVSHYARTP
jgi:hypothetical protein